MIFGKIIKMAYQRKKKQKAPKKIIPEHIQALIDQSRAAAVCSCGSKQFHLKIHDRKLKRSCKACEASEYY
jgi:hypothetical protein